MAGQPGTGKSSALKVVVDTLTLARRGVDSLANSAGASSIRLVKIYPRVFHSLKDFFGYTSPQGDWVDGLFTDAFRKAQKVWFPTSEGAILKCDS